MEKINFKENIPVCCLLIKTFPNGIQQGFETLAREFGLDNRVYYGISYMEDGNIIYKAAVTEATPGEALQKGYEPFTILSGDYLYETMMDWMPKTNEIKTVFGRLMQDSRYDESYPCVEWYKTDKEMLCMVRVKEY